ncbi:MAG: methionine--tRNA ligase subunit beta, partial [Clostridia bacterium]|nr:methionine--tRNA ligase subunit beta [Clostridia bacterium]
MNALNAPEALAEIFRLVDRANKYIDETTPWILAKNPDKKERLGAVLYNLAECIRIAAVILKPFLTENPNKILGFFGIDGLAVTDFDSASIFGYLKPGTKVEKAAPVFPRIDVKKEIEEIEKLVLSRREKEEKKTEKAPESHVIGAEKPEIAIDDFAKVQLKSGKVLAAEKVEKADKLLHLTVKTGERVRSIVSGIAGYYTPEEMVGKTVVVVANLKPVKLRGILSEGMILCGEDEKGNLTLVTTLAEIADGAEVR